MHLNSDCQSKMPIPLPRPVSEIVSALFTLWDHFLVDVALRVKLWYNLQTFSKQTFSKLHKTL